MNITNHLLIDKIMYDYFKRSLSVRLNESRLLQDNIAPDYGLSLPRAMYTRGNYWEAAVETLRQLSYRERGAPPPSTRRFSARLSIVCRFLVDFFCYAHMPNFHGGLVKHITHERRLGLYCHSHYPAPWRADLPQLPLQSDIVEQVIGIIERLNDGLRSKSHSSESEILSTLAARNLAGQAAPYNLGDSKYESSALYSTDEIRGVSSRI